jgi:opacity protein-like surface antigen
VGRIGLSLIAIMLLPCAARADEACSPRSAPYERLACHERTAWTTGKAANCLRLNGDESRLACFDRVEREPPAPPLSVNPVSATLPAAKRYRWRVETGVGYGLGHYDGNLGKMSRQLVIDSFVGVRGWTAHVALWDDRLISDKVSIGGEFLRIDTRARMHGYVANGPAPFTDPIQAAVDAEVNADLYYLNLAYRPRQNDTIRPFAGGGIGGGKASMHSGYSVGEFFSASGQQDISSWIGGVQAFAGTEIDLGWGFHLTPAVRVLYFTTRPLLPHDFAMINLELSMGYRF